NVRGFHIPLIQQPRPVQARGTFIWRAGRLRFGVEVLADAFQSGIVHEGGQVELSNLDRRGLTLLSDADDAVTTNGDTQRVRRDGDRRLNLETARRHQLTILIHLERTIAGIGGGPVRQLHLEETLTFNGNVFTVVGLGQVALAVQTLGGDRAHAG